MSKPDQQHSGSAAGRDRLRRVWSSLVAGARWGRGGSKPLIWRVLVPLVFAFAGFLFVSSATSSEGDDLRSDHATSLTSLVRAERDSVDELRAEAAKLDRQIDRLSGSVQDADLTELDEQVRELRTVSGKVELTGPAVHITMDDAPYDQEVPDGFTANDLVVHQQDLQAVVNALWEGGAEGISLQGQRIVATTGIKCVGNTVLLQGVPYAVPYEIVAVGDVTSMVSAVNSSEYINIYKQYTREPVNIGWEMELLPEATLPPFEGSVDLDYAEAVR